ncbi:hypothetical protein IUY40_02770 [Flavobacterium sp. ALJ2]|uniref:hypothetical protein n=1 Tax=Flavobacterium sp. ALJ2 TaxID=2786960 RepID=UPI0018A0D8A6|nr:hypothetical protein [Flavobacterium sp. ALJ2]MBF7090468.1 hypothetical protein [Flavobacterium sp. ALJ2]
MEKTIYELDLHESVVINKESGGAMAAVNEKITIVTRVAGGWLYNTSRIDKNANRIGLSESSVFVPYNDEFTPKNNVKVKGGGVVK